MVNVECRQLDFFEQNLDGPVQGYRVRESKRAKYVSIKVSHLGEVEVVTPPGFDPHCLNEILVKRQGWIQKNLKRIEAERRLLSPAPAHPLPQTLVLRAIAEDWTIDYHYTPRKTATLEETGLYHLTLTSPDLSPEACYPLLRHWLHHKARYHFEPWLREVSHEIGLPYTTMSVRGQKTRWASCSNRQTISLNYKLLFLPRELVRYVFIHELCHTVHLNHSHKFWALVEKKDPDYRPRDTELRKSWRYVPEWVDRKFGSQKN